MALDSWASTRREVGDPSRRRCEAAAADTDKTLRRSLAQALQQDI